MTFVTSSAACHPRSFPYGFQLNPLYPQSQGGVPVCPPPSPQFGWEDFCMFHVTSLTSGLTAVVWSRRLVHLCPGISLCAYLISGLSVTRL